MSLRTLKQKPEFWKNLKLNFFFHIYRLNWEVKPSQNQKSTPLKLKTLQYLTEQLQIKKSINNFFIN